MSGDLPEEATVAPASNRKPWRSAATKPRLSPDQAARQGGITTLAFQLLGGKDAALAFLNGADSALGGRPLDVAIATKAGFAAVEQALRNRVAEG